MEKLLNFIFLSDILFEYFAFALLVQTTWPKHDKQTQELSYI